MKDILLCILQFVVLQYVYACTCGYSVNDKEKKIIVNKHNDLRKLIANGKVPGQPKGINLKRMDWDNYLASQAQDIANECIFRHKKVFDKRWEVGQNLYIQMSTMANEDADWNSPVQDWFNEHKMFTYSEKYVFDKGTGHYTQVVWANTARVGCGYNYYKEGKWYNKLYVCNYGPAGNVRSKSMYKVGDKGCENLC